MKTILLDIDGVLADFVLGFRQLANQRYGVPVYGTMEQLDWSFPDLTVAQQNHLWTEIRESKTFWRDLPVLPTNVLLLEDAVDNHRVYFCTSRPGDSAQYQTAAWLDEKFYITYPTVIVSSEKGRVAAGVGANFALDDKVEHIRQIQRDSSANAFLLDRPYNQDPDFGPWPLLPRAQTVDEFFTKCLK